jgi:uncharacterized protein (DUF305 family)
LLAASFQTMSAASPTAGRRRLAFIGAIVLAVVAGVLVVQRRPDHNAADATYAASMLPHHELGVRMAELAVARADNVLVRRVAFKMQNYQKAELVSLRRWAKSWHATAGDHIHGMLTPAQEAELATLSGPEFDRSFLSEMIRHHEGAIEMSRIELTAGRSSGARTVANSVAKIQQEQIDQMHELLTLVG